MRILRATTSNRCAACISASSFFLLLCLACFEPFPTFPSFAIQPAHFDCSTGWNNQCTSIRLLSWADTDGDGMEDTPGYAYLGNYQFAARPSEAWTLPANTHGASFGDCDNDGDYDLAFTGYGVDSPSAVFRNDSGVFVHSSNTGVDISGGFGEGAAWGDYNGDGLLDLILTFYPAHTAVMVIDTMEIENRVYENLGNCQFRDVTEGSGIANDGVAHRPEGIQTLDVTGDGILDVWVSGRIFRGHGDLSFSNITGQFAMPVLFDEGINFVDFDRDGDFDPLVSGVQRFILYENRGLNSRWPAISNDVSLLDDIGVFGGIVADLDNDGDMDLVAEGNSEFGIPTYIYENAEGIFHKRIEILEVMGSSGSSIDINRDGFLDITINSRRFIINEGLDTSRRSFRLRILSAEGHPTMHGTRFCFESDEDPPQCGHVGNPDGWLSQSAVDDHLTYAPGLDYELSIRPPRGTLTPEDRSLTYFYEVTDSDLAYGASQSVYPVLEIRLGASIQWES